MNVLVNFHMHLHKCIFKVIKRPKIWEPSLQFEITHDIQLRYACTYKSLHPLLCYSHSWTANNSYTMLHIRQAHIYVSISGPYIYEHKHIQKVYM
jgi:hypothetical protein